jgi:transposase
MKAKRKRNDNAFKAKVGLEALKEIRSIQEIAQEFEVHPTQVSKWKKKLEEDLSSVFEQGNKKRGQNELEKERDKLHSKIGQLTIEVDWLKKKSKQLGL